MGYGTKIQESALAELNRRKQSAESEALEKAEAFYTRRPEARAIKAKIAGNAAGAGKAVLRGGDVRGELEKLRENAAKLNAEYDRLLALEGLTREDLQPRYACEKCKDTGIYEGRMCSCLRNLQRSFAYQQLNMDAPLEACTFDAFSLEYYRDDPKVYNQMAGVFAACKSYAEQFRADSPSLLFWGGTGLGKTHLSLAIASAAIEKGFGVIYSSVQSLAVALERERFARHDGDGDTTEEQMLACDLLILDDLGAEFPSSYVNACLSDVINARLLSKKPTIISTNLTTRELEDRYSQRVYSRIMGGYGKMGFLGRDIRLQNRQNRK